MNPAFLRAQCHGDLAAHRGIADSVREQVVQDAFDHADVGVHEGQVGRHLRLEIELFLRGMDLKLLHDVVGQFAE